MQDAILVLDSKKKANHSSKQSYKRFQAREQRAYFFVPGADMKRAQGHGKKPKKAAKRTAGRTKGKTDVGAIQEEIRNLVCGAAIDMVESTIEEVKKGHYSAMKFLFEMVGLHLGTEATAGESEGTMTAETLCQRLGLPMGAEPDVTNDMAATPSFAVMP
jgi:hypothetical protein